MQASRGGAWRIGYDLNCNMSSTGSASFTYASDNSMATGGPGLLYYDPLGRLAWYQNGGATYDYVGDALVTEINSSTQAAARRRRDSAAGSFSRAPVRACEPPASDGERGLRTKVTRVVADRSAGHYP